MDSRNTNNSRSFFSTKHKIRDSTNWRCVSMLPLFTLLFSLHSCTTYTFKTVYQVMWQETVIKDVYWCYPHDVHWRTKIRILEFWVFLPANPNHGKSSNQLKINTFTCFAYRGGWRCQQPKRRVPPTTLGRVLTYTILYMLWTHRGLTHAAILHLHRRSGGHRHDPG